MFVCVGGGGGGGRILGLCVMPVIPYLNLLIDKFHLNIKQKQNKTYLSGSCGYDTQKWEKNCQNKDEFYNRERFQYL